MPEAETAPAEYGGGYGETEDALRALHGIAPNPLTPAERAVIGAAREWRSARTACLGAGTITRDQYDRLARAEGALSDAVRLLEREGRTDG